MKEYKTPELVIDLFEDPDVIVCSGLDDEYEDEWFRPGEDDE